MARALAFLAYASLISLAQCNTWAGANSYYLYTYHQQDMEEVGSACVPRATMPWCGAS